MTGWIDDYSASAVVTLPLSWIVTVWARGLAVVDGCFVLDAIDTPDGIAVAVVRWERVGPRTSEPLTVPGRLWRDREGDWRLRWA